MKLLALLTTLSQPGSGSVFDPTTPPIVLDIPLTSPPLTTRLSGAILYRQDKELSDGKEENQNPQAP